MTSLKQVNFGMNQFCGPAVLSVLTGESTDRCAAVISAVSGKKEIKAVERGHLKEALERLRFNVSECNELGGSTLYGTLYRMIYKPGQYVVFVPHHVIAVEIDKDGGAYVCDNHTKTPLDIKQSARLTQSVELVWKVTRKDPPKKLRDEIRLDRHVGSIHIFNCSVYEKSEDNTEYELGYIRFMDESELKQIVEALNKEIF